MTGSFDQKARIYDLRSQECVFTLNHASQVDEVHMLPGGARAVTVGGPDVRIWDLFAGGTVVHSAACHAKAVTSAAVDASGERLVTAGLDGYVKVHEAATLKTKGVMSFGGQIISVDVTADGKKFAVGMVDGAVEVRTSRKDAGKGVVGGGGVAPIWKEKEFEGWGRGFEREEERGPAVGTKRYFHRGTSIKPLSTDAVYVASKPVDLKPWEKALQKMEHAKAFYSSVETNKPEIVVAIMDELLVRDVLYEALKGREMKDIVPVLHMIQRNVHRADLNDKMCFLLEVLLDIYGDEIWMERAVDIKLKSILDSVKEEIRVCSLMNEILGGVEMVMWSQRAPATADVGGSTT